MAAHPIPDRDGDGEHALAVQAHGRSPIIQDELSQGRSPRLAEPIPSVLDQK
jgi:hypothetical protein